MRLRDIAAEVRKELDGTAKRERQAAEDRRFKRTGSGSAAAAERYAKAARDRAESRKHGSLADQRARHLKAQRARRAQGG